MGFYAVRRHVKICQICAIYNSRPFVRAVVCENWCSCLIRLWGEKISSWNIILFLLSGWCAESGGSGLFTVKLHYFVLIQLDSSNGVTSERHYLGFFSFMPYPTLSLCWAGASALRTQSSPSRPACPALSDTRDHGFVWGIWTVTGRLQ